MKRSVRYGWLIVSLCVVLLAVGCASPYYRVTDPHTGMDYYTEKIDTLAGGSVKVKDARTGSVVTLQNSQVKEISEKEYKAGLAAPANKPTPTPAAAPESAPTVTPAAAPAQAPAVAPAPAEVSAPSGTN